MLSRPCGIFFSSITRRAMIVSIALLIWPVAISAASVRSNVVCREELSRIRREQLAAKLRTITGLPDLKFGDDGFLHEGNTDPAGGSAGARELIANAIHGGQVVVIEEARSRSDVAFARVIPGRWKTRIVNSPPVFMVQIDFLDFEQLAGDERALEAFNVGWGFLHELEHAIHDSSDTQAPGEAGECEAHINHMRRECDLPERADYFSTLLPLTPDNEFKTRLVRLAFEQQQSAGNKKKRYWVVWDANVVGGLEQNQAQASAAIVALRRPMVGYRTERGSAGSLSQVSAQDDCQFGNPRK
jgi:hypothetical protein